MEVFFLMLIWLLSGVAAAWIAGSKGRSAVGYFFLGFFFGPIVPIIVAIAGGYACPKCGRNVPTRAVVCASCGADLRPEQASD